jgi:hypothetical protein
VSFARKAATFTIVVALMGGCAAAISALPDVDEESDDNWLETGTVTAIDADYGSFEIDIDDDYQGLAALDPKDGWGCGPFDPDRQVAKIAKRHLKVGEKVTFIEDGDGWYVFLPGGRTLNEVVAASGWANANRWYAEPEHESDDAEAAMAKHHRRVLAAAKQATDRCVIAERKEQRAIAERLEQRDRAERVREHDSGSSDSEPDRTSEEDSSADAPAGGWTNDALTPGYTGCRQGYPGGYVNGVYWWKPIAC